MVGAREERFPSLVGEMSEGQRGREAKLPLWIPAFEGMTRPGAESSTVYHPQSFNPSNPFNPGSDDAPPLSFGHFPRERGKPEVVQSSRSGIAPSQSAQSQFKKHQSERNNALKPA